MHQAVLLPPTPPLKIAFCFISPLSRHGKWGIETELYTWYTTAAALPRVPHALKALRSAQVRLVLSLKVGSSYSLTKKEIHTFYGVSEHLAEMVAWWGKKRFPCLPILTNEH